MNLIAQASAGTIDYWPIAVLLISVLFIVISIGVMKLHPFISLLAAAVLTGWLSAEGGNLIHKADNFASVIDTVAIGFGSTAGKVGLVIALASIIGMCLMESGAADRIVQAFINLFGEKRAGWALMASGFFLSIPVFFDTVFFLLVPLARSLARRTGKNYLLYVLAIGGGGAITHSIVPPTPGPLLVGEFLDLDLGILIVAGILGGILPAIVSLYFAKLMNKYFPISYASTIGPRSAGGEGMSEPQESAEPERKLPSLFASVLPVILPAFLLAAASVIDLVEQTRLKADIADEIMAVSGEGATIDPLVVKEKFDLEKNNFERYPLYHAIAQFLGDKVVALGIGALLAAIVMLELSGVSLWLLTIIFVTVGIHSAVFRFIDFSGQVFSFNLFGMTNSIGVPLLVSSFIFILGILAATWLIHKSAGRKLGNFGKLCSGPLETAGVIILITSAGGAFGTMIQNTGIATTVSEMAQLYKINLILLAWGVTAFVRIAQGSATVSMLTGAGLMAAILNEPGFSLPYHELYIYLAIGFGSITCSWMNDSGFWIVGRLSGFTEKQTLATWTPMLTLIALVGLVQTMIMAQFFPLIPSVPAAAPGIEAAYVAPTPDPDAASRAFIASVDPL
ncbi:MAG: GntP family permease [Verrucomicrobia bacterium]|nr:GntP family permease [Verrucomicrobiota bacterium]